MIPRERLVLLGLSSAAALTSFAGVLAVLEMAPPAERKPSPALVRAAAPAIRASLPRPADVVSSDRYTYGSAKGLHLSAPVDGLRSTVLPDARTSAFSDPAQPIEPEPPGWLTTTTVWPSAFCSSPATTRITWSVEPPAAQGTMMLIGRSGFQSASAGPARAAPAARADDRIR